MHVPTQLPCDVITFSEYEIWFCLKKNPEHQYVYRSSPDGESYVVRAILRDPEISALRTDLDGEQLGVWCGKQNEGLEYCAKN